MKKTGFILLIITFSMGCRKSLSVEETAQQWVESYYNSEFEKAKLLSTEITKNMIDTVAIELIDEGEIIAFKINQMNCSIKGDSAVCSYLYKDEFENFEEKIHLIRKEHNWLVDEPLADEALTDDEMKLIFEEYEELLKEQLQNSQEDE
jgi:hypothetical protein